MVVIGTQEEKMPRGLLRHHSEQANFERRRQDTWRMMTFDVKLYESLQRTHRCASARSQKCLSQTSEIVTALVQSPKRPSQSSERVASRAPAVPPHRSGQEQQLRRLLRLGALRRSLRRMALDVKVDADILPVRAVITMSRNLTNWTTCSPRELQKMGSWMPFRQGQSLVLLLPGVATCMSQTQHRGGQIETPLERTDQTLCSASQGQPGHATTAAVARTALLAEALRWKTRQQAYRISWVSRAALPEGLRAEAEAVMQLTRGCQTPLWIRWRISKSQTWMSFSIGR
mmetsp:Transcript_38388/g.68872  ORF Transcript_38388/g.68872 Transcript_38388/m.68872 type:complete len:287 (+) Transcript_38388:609-1469(+)